MQRVLFHVVTTYDQARDLGGDSELLRDAIRIARETLMDNNWWPLLDTYPPTRRGLRRRARDLRQRRAVLYYARQRDAYEDAVVRLRKLLREGREFFVRGDYETTQRERWRAWMEATSEF